MPPMIQSIQISIQDWHHTFITTLVPALSSASDPLILGGLNLPSRAGAACCWELRRLFNGHEDAFLDEPTVPRIA